MLITFLITALILAGWSIAVRLAWKRVPEPKLKVRDPVVWRRYGNAGRSLAELHKNFVPPDYPIFTTEYDVEVDASDLWAELSVGREIMQGTWRDAFSRQTGKDLAFLGELSKVLDAMRKAETLVTLLIDHSGSMRGEQAKAVATAVGVLGEVLHDAEINVEILGFTTRSWQGGQARQKWIASDHPAMPGRLCELLHIVYKGSNQSFDDVKDDLHLLNSSGLLRENIDGEAILWAKSRFEASSNKHWVCIVVSDGAPVDDSTLSSNMVDGKCDLLTDHLTQTISSIVGNPFCVIAGLGVKHDAKQYYALSEYAKTNDVILEKLSHLTSRAIEASALKPAQHSPAHLDQSGR